MGNAMIVIDAKNQDGGHVVIELADPELLNQTLRTLIDAGYDVFVIR